MAKEINGKTVTREFSEKAMACGNADELMALAKAEGYELTKDEAESFLAELSDVELGDEVMEKAAGGGCFSLSDYMYVKYSTLQRQQGAQMRGR